MKAIENNIQLLNIIYAEMQAHKSKTMYVCKYLITNGNISAVFVSCSAVRAKTEIISLNGSRRGARQVRSGTVMDAATRRTARHTSAPGARLGRPAAARSVISDRADRGPTVGGPVSPPEVTGGPRGGPVGAQPSRTDNGRVDCSRPNRRSWK